MPITTEMTTLGPSAATVLLEPPVTAPRRPLTLIVDDVAEHADLVVDVLKEAGIDALAVRDVPTAQLVLGEQEIACVVADVCMPGNEDLEFVQWITEHAAGTPVVLLTGHPSIETARRSIDLAVSSYVLKPFEVDDLADRVAEAIRYGTVLTGVERTRSCAARFVDDLEAVALVLRAGRGTSAVGARSLVESSLAAVADALRNIASVASMVEHQGAGHREPVPVAEQAPAQSLLQTIEDAATVLERTKNAFKSKEIAALRRQLESVVRYYRAGLPPRAP